MSRVIVLFLLACLACTRSQQAVQTAGAKPSPYLFVLADDPGDEEPHGDFVAVIDVDPSSPKYAQVVATTPTGTRHGMPHHSEFDMPAGGRPLFGNAFMAGKVFLVDLKNPTAPRVVGTADSVPGYRQPHSFWRMPDGRVLATLQFGDGGRTGDPGGLAMFSADGKLLKVTSAADPAFPDARLRVYAIDGAPATDRVITTSSPMDSEVTAHVVQLWRLSDLALLKTIALPTSAADSSWHYPFEIRFLADGRSAFLNTWNCGFFHLTGLDAEPAIERVMSLPLPANVGCGVPLIVGRYWIMPVYFGHAFHVLDIADPRAPRVVSTLTVDSGFAAHWISRDPGTDRVVLTSDGDDRRVLLARFDSVSGRLTLDSRFRDAGSDRVGVSFTRKAWPHGTSGPAVPHAAVFGAR